MKGTALKIDGTLRARSLVVALLVPLALAAAACGGDDGGDSGGGGDNGGDSGGGGEATSVTVSISDFTFDPSEVSVPAGAEVSVTLENNDSAPHTMTAENLGLDVSADPDGSGEGTFTAPDSGSVEFVCNIHPQMKGEIVVDGSAAADTASTNDTEGGYDY